LIERYAGVAPKGDLQLLGLLSRHFRGRSFLHVNSTRAGGGVAEILARMVPIMRDLGLKVRWEVIEGDVRFFEITKRIHNAIQGSPQELTPEMWAYHLEVNRRNAQKIDLEADFVFIHDPQPVPLGKFRKGGRWVWRCHVDASAPQEAVCEGLRPYFGLYDAAVFSVPKFARAMGVPEYIVLPSIDPLSEKNRQLSPQELQQVAQRFQIPQDRPVILQVSRFDRFKDPLGVIEAYRMVKKYNDCVLVLAGSPATDDPEGEAVLREVEEHAGQDEDIKILLLPPFSDLEINALQRLATVVLQKSLKEGFGLTVAEAMWKGKPVIGGAVGGIPHQIVHGVNGFLVHTVEGAAFRIRQFLNDPQMLQQMGQRAREHVRANFLITRQVRDYLCLCLALENEGKTIIEIL
jgi:trehalose synthase